MKLIRTAFLLVILYACVLGALFFGQRLLIYVPDRSIPDFSSVSWAEPFDVVTSDGLTLNAVWSPPSEPDRPVIMFFHGNAGNIQSRISKAEEYIARGYGVVLAEYRGYGGNLGDPSEITLYRDARAYLNTLRAREGIPLDQIVLYGESLGSGVATQMAVEFKAKALVLDVPFSSLLDVAKLRFPWVLKIEYILQDHYRNDQKIKAIKMPVLIGLAEKDQVIPVELGLGLAELAVEPKTVRIFKDADHMGIYRRGFAEEVIRFISQAE